MYITVRLLNGFPRPFTYQIPPEWVSQDLCGKLVRVPLQNRTEIALIYEVLPELSFKPTFIIKQAYALEILPPDPFYIPFIKKLSTYYAIEPLMLYQRLHAFLKSSKTQPIEEDEVLNKWRTTEASATILTYEQQQCVDAVSPFITTPVYQPFLIHGVTGSGKTEIYKKLMLQALELNKSVLFLVPEVTLAVQFFQLLRKQLGVEIPLFSFHSATGQAEKKNVWQHLLAQKPVIIIGVHLPVLLPIANLGLIIIDEEHEVGYQEKRYPKINSKEAALLRAHISKIPLVLGSATPSITSLYNVETKNWQYHQLTHRFAGAFPTIKVVKLDHEKRRHFWITKELDTAIQDRLQKKEQTIVFLNRRGYSFFIQCKKCHYICMCPACSVSLTLHEDTTLRCHYCTFTQSSLQKCPMCGASESAFLKKGIGTQQVVGILQKLFPHARIARADLDTTINKKHWQTTLEAMHNQTIDILVGTQTITKGYHFPQVTLVGILWADVNLNIPFYNAAETTLAQLIQVAGRAGRQHQESLVIVQTMREHMLYKYLNEIEYKNFYEYEKTFRTLLKYPPFQRLVEIEIRHNNEQQVDHDAQLCKVFLQQQLNAQEHILLGPAQPPVHKIKNVFIRKLYIKTIHLSHVQHAYKQLLEKKLASSLFYTPHPLQ
ncbi:MAG: primosomal protein N' [Candidatus Babeliaceae bacterium]